MNGKLRSPRFPQEELLLRRLTRLAAQFYATAELYAYRPRLCRNLHCARRILANYIDTVANNTITSDRVSRLLAMDAAASCQASLHHLGEDIGLRGSLAVR